MDRTVEKRKRSCNFQLSETRLLVDTVLPFRDIIENKANDSFNIQEKNHAWEKIAAIFNTIGCGEVHRNSKVLKLKYEGIKKLLRRKLAEHKREMYESGRDTSTTSGIKMEDYEEKMFSIVLCNGEINNGQQHERTTERYDLSNTSTYDDGDEDTEMMLETPELEDITIKNEIITSPHHNIETNSINNEAATSAPPSLSEVTQQNRNEQRTIPNENSTRNLKWKQFNTRKIKVKKTLQFQQHSRTENINKFKYQDNEITRQEFEIQTLKIEHELRKKILERELEEKEAILRRNEEEHRLKMRLMEIQLKHKELELLSKINN